eukprot:15361298-Ditylum_brightwellii.AAC.1
MACIYWSKSTTTKGLHHITIRKNAIREATQNNIVTIKHIAGNINLADTFTKEHKDVSHFITIRNQLATTPFLPQDVPIT